MNFNSDKSRLRLHVCTQLRYAPNPHSCANSGSETILKVLRDEMLLRPLDVDVVASSCMHMCNEGPNVKLSPFNIKWSHVSVSSIPEIIEACKKTIENS